MKQKYLECGKVRSAHGVRGYFKTECWCDTPKVLAAQKRVFLAEKDGTFTERRVTSATVAGDSVILGIEGVTTREDAVALKNTVLYLDRDDVPVKRGAVLLVDLIGLPVTDADTGRRYGEIVSVDEQPASRIYTVKTPSGAEVLIPDVPVFVKRIDPDAGLFLTPIPGFFDEEETPREI